MRFLTQGERQTERKIIRKCEALLLTASGLVESVAPGEVVYRPKDKTVPNWEFPYMSRDHLYDSMRYANGYIYARY